MSKKPTTDANESMRQRVAQLERHHKRGAALAQNHAEMLVEEREMADVLKEHRKRIDELVLQLADHSRTDPNQTELADILPQRDEAPERLVGKDAAAGG